MNPMVCKRCASRYRWTGHRYYCGKCKEFAPEAGWADLDGTPQPPPPRSEQVPAKLQKQPAQYEDQYGTRRWSDTHDRVNP